MLGINPDDGQKDRETGKPKLADWEMSIIAIQNNHPPDNRVEHSRD